MLYSVERGMTMSTLNAGKIRLIGQVGVKDKVVGYAILMNDNTVKLFPLKETKEMIQRFGCVNAGFDEKGNIVGTEASLNRLPVYNSQGQVIGQPRITILSAVYHTNGLLGYDILDAHGKQIRYVENDVLILMNKVGATNAKLVHKGRKPVISAIFGEFPKIQLPRNTGSSNVQVSKKDVGLKPVEERTEFELFDEVKVEVAVTKRAYIYHHDCCESGDGWNEPHVYYDDSECTMIFWGKLRAVIKELKPPRISRKHILERMKKGDIGFECRELHGVSLWRVLALATR